MPSTFAATPDASLAAKPDDRAGKYLTFFIGKEEFGVGVMKVREIMGMQDITAVPGTRAYLRGVMNLRGKIIPVIDLRLKFGLPAVEGTKRTCVVVVQVDGAAIPLPMGIIVDEVSEVLILTPADIEDTPDFGLGAATTYILGMAKIKGRVKILLDIGAVLSSQEIGDLETILPSGPKAWGSR
jgi:Chemotaxis signal transduction protein